MRRGSDWRDVWRKLLPRQQMEIDINSELSFHIEEETENLMEAGLTEAEARRQATSAFGNVEGARKEMSALAGRRVNRQRLEDVMEGMFLGIKQATRGLAQRPAFSCVVILTLGLGIGANTAVFSALNSILLRPLPYDEPDRLVRIYDEFHRPTGEIDYAKTPLSAPEFTDYRSASEIFEEVASFNSYRELGADLTGGERPERVVIMPVSSGFAHVLGAAPALGRSFTREEERAEVALAVISHGLWRRRFGGVADVLGKSLELDGISHEIIGVMPQGFRGALGGAVEVWTPTNLSPDAAGYYRWNHYLSAVGRLAAGVTFEQAQARLEILSRNIAEEEGLTVDGGFWAGKLVPLHEDTVGGTKATLWVLMAAVCLVLLSTCVNVANLFLVRSFSRAKELAIRAALGAGKGGLIRHLLNESLILSVIGGGLGLGLAWGGIRALTAIGPAGLPRAGEVGVDSSVLIFTLVVSVLTGLVFGLTPMLQLSRHDLTRELRERDRGRSGGRRFHHLRSALVVAEIAVALILLVGAGTLMRSFLAIRAVDLKVKTDRVLTYEVHLPDSRYNGGNAREAFYRAYYPRVRALPGVEAVGATSWLPISGSYTNWGIGRPGEVEKAEDRRTQAEVRVVGGAYFSALDIGLISGRYLEDQDDPSAPKVVVVNQLVQDEFFDGQEILGRTLGVGGAERIVVGVVEDVPMDAFGETGLMVYLPHAQFADDRNWALTQTVSFRGDESALIQGLRLELATVDPNLVLYRVRPLNEVIGAALLQQRFALFLMESFAGLAVLLAFLGIYGVLSYIVTQRKREIGIRIALGAGTAGVQRLVVKQGLALAAGGIALGLAAALYLSRWLQSLVFEVKVADPWVFGCTALALGAVASAAAYLPARRAARVDPALTFRED